MSLRESQCGDRMTPKFQNASEQLIFYVKRFASFCAMILKKTGVTEIPEPDKIDEVLEAIPAAIYVAYVMEVSERFGPELDAGELGAVAKVIAMMSKKTTVDGLTKEMNGFVQELENDTYLKQKFFLYWRTISKIVKRI